RPQARVVPIAESGQHFEVLQDVGDVGNWVAKLEPAPARLRGVAHRIVGNSRIARQEKGGAALDRGLDKGSAGVVWHLTQRQHRLDGAPGAGLMVVGTAGKARPTVA